MATVASSALLSGNQAIARGAWEAGVRLAAAYPGTPSTEILEALRDYDGIYCEWSTNEKVALEVAVGASMAGARALSAMKHVGLNVAADPLFSSAYMGVNGGLVIVSADDPGAHSSQNEQDNRLFAAAARIALIEPSTPEECRLFTIRAFELSEKFDTPVLLRTTTRLSHGRAEVMLSDPVGAGQLPYRKLRTKNVLLPAHARVRHRIIEEQRMPKLAEAAESWVHIDEGDDDVAIITAGVPYLYAREAFPNAAVLKLGMTYPLPEKLVREFAAKHKRILVVEELEPFLEQQVRALGIHCETRWWPRYGEITVSQLRTPSAPSPPRPPQLPMRPPVLCSGCAHRSTFQVLSRMNVTVAGDIGCYTLGALPPLDSIDSCMNMGASIGMAHGFAKVNAEKPVVAVIGDSTFFHSGVPALMDVIYHRSDATVVVLDNRTTAMTGHQDSTSEVISVTAIARAMGITDVREPDAYDLIGLWRTIDDAIKTAGVSVIVVKAPCVLKEKTTFGAPLVLNTGRCTDCFACTTIGCPAIALSGDRLQIDPLLCIGCAQCQQLCADCNAGLDIPLFLELVNQHRFNEAADLLLEINPIPAVSARVCPHPCDHGTNALGLRQAHAERYPDLFDRFDSIRAIEQWVADYAIESGHTLPMAADRGRTVAVLGSGPAGLSAAWQLRKRGWQVSVLDRMAQPGGVLRYGIPEFRLSRAVLDAEIDRMREAGSAFYSEFAVNDPGDFEKLRASYDAIVIATGHGKARPFPNAIPGLEFLAQFNSGTPPEIGKRVAIIGGGNTAIDCARAAVRMGADVDVVYRRTEREMPAIPDEVADARAEGVRFRFQQQPTPDVLNEYDTVIAAIGEDSDFAISLAHRFTGETALKGVFVCGDVAFGYGTVTQSVASGRKTAEAVSRYLETLT